MKGSPKTEIKLNFNQDPSLSDDDSIDYHTLSPFSEVLEGMVLAEEVPCCQDCTSNVIKYKPSQLKAGKNVLKETNQDGFVSYIALSHGIVYLQDGTLLVEKTLIIRGNVDYSTGNLNYDGNILILGDVKSTFNIICGKDLTIRKTIEDKVSIDCKGNLSVEGGIQGESTHIKISRDLKCGFIQNAHLYVSGNAVIERSIYNTYITCRGNLSVLGKRFKSNDRGAVIGGIINSFNNLVLHSAGSLSSTTELISGIDLSLENELEEMKLWASSLIRKIEKCQEFIGIDIKSPDIIKYIKNKNDAEKKKIQFYLQKTKELTLDYQKAKHSIGHLEKSYYNQERTHISIEHQCYPDTKIRIGPHSTIVRSPIMKKHTWEVNKTENQLKLI